MEHFVQSANQTFYFLLEIEVCTHSKVQCNSLVIRMRLLHCNVKNLFTSLLHQPELLVSWKWALLPSIYIYMPSVYSSTCMSLKMVTMPQQRLYIIHVCTLGQMLYMHEILHAVLHCHFVCERDIQWLSGVERVKFSY